MLNVSLHYLVKQMAPVWLKWQMVCFFAPSCTLSTLVMTFKGLPTPSPSLQLCQSTLLEARFYSFTESRQILIGMDIRQSWLRILWQYKYCIMHTNAAYYTYMTHSTLHLSRDVTTSITNGPKSIELLSNNAMRQHQNNWCSTRNICSWSQNLSLWNSQGKIWDTTCKSRTISTNVSVQF